MKDIDGFYRTMSHEAGLAPSTVKQMHNVLTGSLDQAVRWGRRSDNPAKLATLPKARPGELRLPSPDAVIKALQMADHEFATFLRLSATVGGRRGEISRCAGPASISRRGAGDLPGVGGEQRPDDHARRTPRRIRTGAWLWTPTRSRSCGRAGRGRSAGGRRPGGLRPDGFVFSPSSRDASVAALPLDECVASAP